MNKSGKALWGVAQSHWNQAVVLVTALVAVDGYHHGLSAFGYCAIIASSASLAWDFVAKWDAITNEKLAKEIMEEMKATCGMPSKAAKSRPVRIASTISIGMTAMPAEETLAMTAKKLTDIAQELADGTVVCEFSVTREEPKDE